MSKKDTSLRQWLLLRSIPRHPRKITAKELWQILENEGYEVTKRSIERNLHELSAVWPMLSDERSRPYGWSWQPDAPLFSLPGMSPVQALALTLARNHLASLLPAGMLETLGPYFDHANTVLLTGEGIKNMADWREKVAIVSSNQELVPPQYDENVVATVHSALFSEKQLEIDYIGRGVEQKTHVIHPLGLVQRGAVIYLVATMYTYEDIRILALHRIVSATILDKAAKGPKNFRLSEYIAKGSFGFTENDEPIRISVRFEADSAEHLRETPLSRDQEIIEEGQTVRLKATVPNSQQLRWWLRSFGAQIEVLEPESLRNEFVEMAGAFKSVYKLQG